MRLHLHRLIPIVFTKTVHNLLYVFAGTAGSALLRFGISLILAAFLEPEAWGALVVCIGILDLAAVLGDSGLNSSLVQFGAQDKATTLLPAFQYCLAIKFIFSTTAAVLLLALGPLATTLLLGSGFTWLYYVAVISGLLLSFNSFFITVFHATERFQLYAMLSLALNVLRLPVVLFVAIRFPDRADLFFIGFFFPIPIVAVATGLSATMLLRRKSSATPIDTVALRSFLWPLTLFGIISIATQRADVFLIGYFCSATEVGEYGIAFHFAYLLPILGSAGFTALLPKGANLGLAELKTYRRKVLALWPLVVGITVTTAGVGYLSLTLFFGAKYPGASAVILPLVLGLGVYLIVPPVSIVLYALKKTWEVTLLHALQLAMIVTLDVLLIPRFGAVGAAVSILISRSLMAIAVLMLTRSLLMRTTAVEHLSSRG